MLPPTPRLVAIARPADPSVSHTTLGVHSTADLQSVSCTLRDRDVLTLCS